MLWTVSSGRKFKVAALKIACIQLNPEVTVDVVARKCEQEPAAYMMQRALVCSLAVALLDRVRG